MYSMIQIASRMAIDATTELFGAASSSAAKRGAPMQRHFRDSAIYLGHISARHDVVVDRGRADALRASRQPVLNHEISGNVAARQRPTLPEARSLTREGDKVMTRRATPPFRADHVGSCCARPRCSPRGMTSRPGNRRRRAGRGRGRRDQGRGQAAGGRRAAGPRPTGSSGASSGTPTSSTRSPASTGARSAQPLPVYTKDGQITWTPNVTEVTGPVRLEDTIFGDHFTFLKNTVRPRCRRSPFRRRPWRTSASTCPGRRTPTTTSSAPTSPPSTPPRSPGFTRWLPVPAVRRHDLRVPQRPAVAGQRQGHRA